MAEDILVRRVPSRVHSWIENERQQRRMTKQEFVLSVLEKLLMKADSYLFLLNLHPINNQQTLSLSRS